MVVSVMTLIGVITSEIYVARHLGYSVWHSYLLPTLMCASTIGVSMLITPFIPYMVWVSAPIKGFACALIFGMALYIFEHKSVRDVWDILKQGLKADERT